MKKSAFIPAIGFLMAFFACTPPVTFDQPQPANTATLTSLPKRLQGSYQSLKDNSLLTINDHAILRIYDYNLKKHIGEPDSNYRFSGDSVIDLNDNLKTTFKREGDSIIFHIHSVDTLFLLSDENVLKKFRGYYFLNLLYQKSGWEVKKLGLSKGELTISGIKSKEEIDLLKTFSENNSDTVPFQVRPTKKQFLKFIKAEGFSEKEVFTRLHQGNPGSN